MLEFIESSLYGADKICIYLNSPRVLSWGLKPGDWHGNKKRRGLMESAHSACIDFLANKRHTSVGFWITLKIPIQLSDLDWCWEECCYGCGLFAGCLHPAPLFAGEVYEVEILALLALPGHWELLHCPWQSSLVLKETVWRTCLSILKNGSRNCASVSTSLNNITFFVRPVCFWKMSSRGLLGIRL